MDVRCEKCQTEYELDEARLKPGGVTVKCTNCGHMFKIRKRSNTNVGVPTVVATPPSGPNERPRTPSGKPQRADSILGELAPAASEERQWLIRLENGEQKSCRELAMLQQWIVGGVATRESLISRTGKTWKRLGDITELAQYFTIADEARSQRTAKPTPKPVTQGTMLGIGASAAGGTIIPDDDEQYDARTTGSFSTRPGSKPTPPPPRRPITQPPPPPIRKERESQSGPLPSPSKPAPSVPISNRSTAAWATDGVSPTADTQKDEGPSGPFGGRVKPSSEPAFAGRVRVAPGDESAFNTGKVTLEDDDDLLPQRRGSRSGTLLLVMALLVMGVAAGVVYVFVIKKSKDDTTAKAPADAATVAATADAATVTAITPDASAVVTPAQTPVDLARAELGPDLESKLRDALRSLDGKTDAGVEAMRAHLGAQIAQGLYDRAVITADKTEAEKLKKDAKTLVIDAATAAQRAFKATPEDPGANLAMAEVLRLQDKSIKDVRRYLDTAKARQTDDWKREIALADAQTLLRDKKLDEAKAAFAAIDSGDDKLEATGDVRARFHLALVTYAQNKPADAKPLVEQILAAQPEHAGAKALAARIENTVSKVDPLPPEEGSGAGSAKPNVPTGPGPGPNVNVGSSDTYDSLLARANKLAESNCAKATELFGKALEQKPNGVEALTGMGYCHIDAKQFASAFSKFRAALAISSRYEPALWGVAEAYTQQGRKEQAIEAVKAYLDAYPGSPKGTKALDRLGGSAAPTPPVDKPPPVEKPPEVTPPTEQPQKPADPGTGSGSG